MKQQKKRHISTLMAGLFFAAAVSAESLQETVQKTINENPEVQSAKDERNAISERISLAKSGYFPKVDLHGAYGWEQSNNPSTRRRVFGGQIGTTQYHREEAGVTVRQMLFDGMETYNEVKRQKAATDAKAYTVFDQSEITALNAAEAYLNVLRQEELVQLAKENLDIHQRTNDQIILRSERGVGKKADIEQSLGRLALAESNYKSEAGNLEDAKTAYLRVVGALPGKLDAPVDPASGIPANLEQAIETAINNHPVLKSANSDVDEANAQHDTAMSPYFPRIDVVVGSTRNNNLDGVPGTNSDLYALLELNYNIFNGGKDVARRDETAHFINQAKDIRDNTYRQVVESMRLSWVAHQTVKSQMEFFKEHRDASIKANDAYQKQFNIGQRTLLDLLDSANEMYEAKSAYANARYDELFAQYRILTSMGGLNNFLQVKLPEEIKPITKEDHS